MPCPSAIEYKGELSTVLIEFNIDKSVSGSTTQTTKVNTNPITFISKEIKYKWMKINLGCNTPKSKHWPKICDWVETCVKKKVKFCGYSHTFSTYIPLPSKCYDEVYTTHEKLPSYIVYTVPSFNFNFKCTLGCNINLESTFEIDSEGEKGAVGGLLQDVTQDKINEIYGLTFPNTIGNMPSDDRVAFLIDKVESNLATGILIYLLNDSLKYKYIITSFSSTLNIDVDAFEISFGDYHIKIPQFQINVTIPNFLEEHPITMAYKDGKFSAEMLLYTTKDKDTNFFKMMLDGISATIEKYEHNDQTTYDINELKNIQKQLNNKKDEVTIWLENYIGLTYELKFSSFICLSSKTGVAPPPSPLSIKIEFTVTFNPYKILEKLLDVTTELQSIMEKVENELLEDIKDIPGSFSHTLDSLMESSLKQFNKVINKGLKAAQNDITKKYLDKELEFKSTLYVPVDP